MDAPLEAGDAAGAPGHALVANGDPFLALGALPRRANVARLVFTRAREAPERVAVRDQDGRTTTFAELAARVEALAHGFEEAGLRPGERVSLFVRPGADLVAVAFALFALGAVPVLIDPGMGRKQLLGCIARVRPRALVAVPEAHALRLVWRGAFRTVELAVTVGRPCLWRGPSLAELERRGAARGHYGLRDTVASDAAAILFTSGSTGPPKGVVYTHGMFGAQVRALAALYDLRPGEVDVACFPLFALLDAGLGITAVFPDIDPAHPGRADPARVHRALAESGATLSFGSPAIWRRLAPWCRERGLTLPGLRRILVAGAPIAPALVEELARLLPDGEVHTPYGATEALPVTSIAGREILALRARSESGAGTCIGRPAPGIDLRLIRITDDALPSWSDALELPRGELGELCVRGPVVTREYADDEAATARAKLPFGGKGTWHRMGDLGYLDDEGRLWFCGRKAHRLETRDGLVAPVPLENVFDTHPAVRRSALVGVGARGAEEPVLVVEPTGRLGRARRLAPEILAHGRARGVARPIARVLFKRSFPVDVRHEAKIRREDLKRWAEQALA